MAIALRNVTISEAMSKAALEVLLSSVSGITVGMIAVVNREAMLVNRVDTANVKIGVQRGYAGTASEKHASGSVIWVDKAEYYSTVVPSGAAAVSEETAVPRIVLPAAYAAPQARMYRIVNDSWVEVDTHRLANQYTFDPDTGYEYLLVDCQNAFQVGEWIVVDPDGLATQLASTSKGRVGIIVETISGSDTLSWAIVAGKYASALTTSDVTTAADLIAGAGVADILTSTGGNLIMGAAATVAPSTATAPPAPLNTAAIGTVYLHRPWVSGEIHSWSSVGT